MSTGTAFMIRSTPSKNMLDSSEEASDSCDEFSDSSEDSSGSVDTAKSGAKLANDLQRSKFQRCRYLPEFEIKRAMNMIVTCMFLAVVLNVFDFTELFAFCLY